MEVQKIIDSKCHPMGGICWYVNPLELYSHYNSLKGHLCSPLRPLSIRHLGVETFAFPPANPQSQHWWNGNDGNQLPVLNPYLLQGKQILGDMTNSIVFSSSSWEELDIEICIFNFFTSQFQNCSSFHWTSTRSIENQFVRHSSVTAGPPAFRQR